jgi:hypothetical protein
MANKKESSLTTLLSDTEESREINELALVQSCDDKDQLWNPQVKQKRGYPGETSTHLSTKTLLQVPRIDKLAPRHR